MENLNAIVLFPSRSENFLRSEVNERFDRTQCRSQRFQPQIYNEILFAYVIKKNLNHKGMSTEMEEMCGRLFLLLLNLNRTF